MKAQPFTHQEQIEVLNACGIPMCGTFEFQFANSTCVDLQLRPDGVAVKGEPPQAAPIIKFLLTLWCLQSFANVHGLGDFSRSMPMSELQQVSEVMDRLGEPIYGTMPIGELIPRMQAEFRRFWAGFHKKEAA